MYYEWAYLSLGLLVALVPFCIPVRIKSPALRTVRNGLLILFCVSVLVASTPDRAVKGAPIHRFGEASIAYSSCNSQIAGTRVKFCHTEKWWDFADCYCVNPNARATMAYCYSQAHPEQIDSFLQTCQRDYNVTLTRDEFDEALLNYSTYSRSFEDLTDAEKSKILDFPIKLDPELSKLYGLSYDEFLGNYDKSIEYGGYLMLFWIVVFALAAIGNWSKLVFPKVFKKLVGPVSNSFRQKISLPATWGKRKTNEKPFLKVLDLLVPTRAETIILAVFTVFTAYFFVINIHTIENDPVFDVPYKTLLRLHAVRASILTSCMMPLLILFGGRNNFLQWITRWDYSTFITFHRWLSRVIVLLVFVHALFYSLYSYHFTKMMKETYIIFGTIAFLSGVFILFQGLLVLRRKWYEAFLIIHIVLAFLFVGGAYVHVWDIYCLWFYHMSLAIWVFDRVVRIGRLFSFGFPNASVYLLADESLKVVMPKPAHWEAVPGGHGFIHFLRPSCFWQSHPFTYTLGVENEDEIIMFIKVKDGVTQSLYEYLHAHPGKCTQIRVAVEGSYGETTPASRYDSAVFVAGGNGIPGIYAEALDLAKKDINQTIKMYWVVREFRSLLWFYEELVSLKKTNIETIIYVTQPASTAFLEEFDLRFPTTRGDDSSVESHEEEPNEFTKLKTTAGPSEYGTSTVPMTTTATSMEVAELSSVIDKMKQELSHITFLVGRPSMDQIVRQTTKESIGSTAYITCGHPVMVDDLRAAVVHNINNDEHKRIDYFEQLQVWA